MFEDRSFRGVLAALRANHFAASDDASAKLLESLGAAIGALFSGLQPNEQPRMSTRLGSPRSSGLPDQPASSPAAVAPMLVNELLAGAVNWMSPRLFHNVGAAPCIGALAVQGATVALNTYAINDDLAGRAMEAEQRVAAILADLADLDPKRATGLFSFGGTATNLYAMRLGLRKALPSSARTGLRDARVKLAVTADAHFSHATNADWLGVGRDDLIVIGANADRTSNPCDAERQICQAIEAGYLVPAILINGGTTYDHAIDDVAAFAELRDRLVSRYGLSYRPHLHVDSVIGWAWLFFRNYDFEANPWEFEPVLSAALHKQTERISQLGRADSWGVDFHKGVGSCPVDSSVFMINDSRDLNWLSKAPSSGPLHQLNPDASRVMLADVTLETSRSAAKAMAALGALQTLGLNGYRALLANLVENALLLRTLVADQGAGQLQVLGGAEGAYVTMLRLLPPGSAATRSVEAEDPVLTEQISSYMAAFNRWDRSFGLEDGPPAVEYSYSSRYRRTAAGRDVPALKLYPTSPYLAARHVHDAVAYILKRKATFDSWPDQGWQQVS